MSCLEIATDDLVDLGLALRVEGHGMADASNSNAGAGDRRDAAESSGDDIVAEMLRALPWSVVWAVHLLFQNKYRGIMHGEPKEWRFILMVFINKVLKPKCLDDFRGVSLLSVLSKLQKGTC